jgi:hypothetical protein
MATLDYDPASGEIQLVTDHGTLSFDGCGPDLEFCRQGESAEPEHALWITPSEAQVLQKMVSYCLTKLPNVTPTSRSSLEAIAPRLSLLVDRTGG